MPDSNPYQSGVANNSPSDTRTRATWPLIWAGIVALALAVACVLATVIGVMMTFDDVATNAVADADELARGISASLAPAMFAFPLTVLGIALVIVGVVRRRPVSKQVD